MDVKDDRILHRTAHLELLQVVEQVVVYCAADTSLMHMIWSYSYNLLYVRI